jgi:hypothetical protein
MGLQKRFMVMASLLMHPSRNIQALEQASLFHKQVFLVCVPFCHQKFKTWAHPHTLANNKYI